MIIKEIGKYELLKDIFTRNISTIATISKGAILDINQINKEYHQVIGEPLLDWTYWDLPVRKIE